MRCSANRSERCALTSSSACSWKLRSSDLCGGGGGGGGRPHGPTAHSSMRFALSFLSISSFFCSFFASCSSSFDVHSARQHTALLPPFGWMLSNSQQFPVYSGVDGAGRYSFMVVPIQLGDIPNAEAKNSKRSHHGPPKSHTGPGTGGGSPEAAA